MVSIFSIQMCVNKSLTQNKLWRLLVHAQSNVREVECINLQRWRSKKTRHGPFLFSSINFILVFHNSSTRQRKERIRAGKIKFLPIVNLDGSGWKLRWPFYGLASNPFIMHAYNSINYICLSFNYIYSNVNDYFLEHCYWNFERIKVMHAGRKDRIYAVAFVRCRASESIKRRVELLIFTHR